MKKMTYIAPKTSVTKIEVESFIMAGSDPRTRRFHFGNEYSKYPQDEAIEIWEEENGATI